MLMLSDSDGVFSHNHAFIYSEFFFHVHRQLERNLYSYTIFNFLYLFNRLVNPKVVRACTVVLTDWEKISNRTIKSAITLLHRIAFGCKMHVMLFQVNKRNIPITIY